MRILYLANVGNRDLYVDGEPIPSEVARERGEEIARSYDAYRARLSAPILEAGLEYAHRQAPRDDGVEITVALFPTNQAESAGDYRRSDTVHLADVLKRYLSDRFLRTSVRVFPISNNPSYYDEMLEDFGERLRSKKNFSPDNYDVCYVSPVGGVPAANFALLLRAVERFADKCQPVYVPRGSRHAVSMTVGKDLQRGVLQNLVRQELENNEFGRAAALLRQLEAEPLLIGLAEHAQHRLNFDFDRAAHALDSRVVPTARGDDRALALRLREGLDGLLDKRLEILIGELFFNTRITFQAGRYVDFLLRVFRLQEAVLRLIVEGELGLPTDPEPKTGKAKAALVEGIEGNEALRAHMAQRFQGRVLDYHRPATRDVLRHLTAYIQLQRPDDHELVNAMAIADRLAKLGDLRNRSIGGHGFSGVAREEIVARYGQETDILADLAEMVRYLGVDPDADPYRQIREILLSGVA